MLGISGRRHAANCFFGSVLVVFASPAFDLGACMQQRWEPVFFEAFVAQPAVERFDLGVLVWFARLDEP